MKYANVEINITEERMVEIASLLISGMLECDEESTMEYLADTVELTEEEASFFDIDYQKMMTSSRYA